MSALESELEIREAEVDPASQAPVIVSSGFTSVFGTTTVKQEPSYPSFALPPGSRAFSSGLSRSMVSSVWRRSVSPCWYCTPGPRRLGTLGHEVYNSARPPLVCYLFVLHHWLHLRSNRGFGHCLWRVVR